jgi:chromosome segregation ATPase
LQSEERVRYEQQIADLQQKLTVSCRRQHEIENILEEFEVIKSRQTQQTKEINRKYYDLQKKYTVVDKERKELVLKVEALKKDNKTAMERWLRANSQARKEERTKNKMKIIEEKYEEMVREVEDSQQMIFKLQNEINLLTIVIESKEELLAKLIKTDNESDTVDKRIFELEQEMVNIKKKEQKLTQELTTKENTIKGLEREMKELREENIKLKEETNDSDILNTILNLHSKAKQTISSLRKLLKIKSNENHKYKFPLNSYNKINELILEADRNLISIKISKSVGSLKSTSEDKENQKNDLFYKSNFC